MRFTRHAANAVRGICLIAVTWAPVAAGAGGSEEDEQACQKGRYDASAKYASCQRKVFAKRGAGTLSDDAFVEALSRCRTRYTATWDRLRTKASGTGSTCDNDRYDVVTNPDTVLDRLTGLQWEVKTNDGTVRDKDNTYVWDSSPGFFAEGTVFTDFLRTLNSGSCFAGECDWRLPTIYEAQTILLDAFPCSAPCIDQAVFGPGSGLYWTASEVADFPYAWFVNFNTGYVYFDSGNATFLARAVRGGL